MKKICMFVLILLLGTGVYAKDLSGLYDQGMLRNWQQRYAKNIRWDLDNVILPVLQPSERKVLAGVRLQFPLKGESESGALEFYSDPHSNPPVVVMPVLSLKFFDDLTLAIAWLSLNFYTPDTPMDYVAMLKYLQPTSFPGGQYLPPLKALHIPANAVEDNMVSNISQKIMKSARMWVLIHELAHVYYKHPGYGQNVSFEKAQQNEIEADRFATDIMRRINVPPIGNAYFFTIAVHWYSNRSDFQSEAAWRGSVKKANHPLTTKRLSILARDLKSEPESFVGTEPEPNYRVALAALSGVSSEIEKLAAFLADENLQKAIKKRALLLSDYSDPLKPRPVKITPEAAKIVGRVYHLANPLFDPGTLKTYVQQNKRVFTENSTVIRCAKLLGTDLFNRSIKSFGQGDYDRAYSSALGMGATGEMARDVANSISSGSLDLFVMGQDLYWLGEVLPSAADGNWRPFETTGTQTRRQIRQVLPFLKGMMAEDPAMKGIVDAIGQQYQPIIEEQIVSLAIMTGVCK